MTNYLLDLLKLVGSLIPIFGGFLYYVGRRFTESYYETLGVPHEALNLSVADYLFKSMQSWVFLIAIALTYLVFILWQSVFKKPEFTLEIPSQVARKKSKSEVLINIGRMIIRVFRPKKGDPQLLMLCHFFYSIFGLALVLIWILPTAEPNFPAEAFTETMMLVFSIGLAWLIMTDKPTINFVRARKRLAQLFIASIVFTMIISMQLLPHGIGRFAGIVQTNPYRIEQAFPSIKIIANKTLWSQDIGWVEQDSMYETKDRLILILENNDGVFVKRVIEEEISEVFKIKKTSETYYIPNSNIEGLSINIPGKFPKVEEN
ncbi:hypothetical protein ES703_15209 [subsurface metagenome]